MKLKERRAAYEMVAIGYFGFATALTVPALISAHDSVALIAALMLPTGWAGWAAYFLYRLNNGE